MTSPEHSRCRAAAIISRRGLLAFGSIGCVFVSMRTRAAPRTIYESGFIPIGGIDQWIAIQGRDATNPAILYLHGGPGEAQSPFLKLFLPWEQAFTVANWDQRGSGKTFGRNGSSTPAMTLDRLVDDALEVTQHVCDCLGKKKVILVGQSWGSFLGVHAIKRRPGLFHAFVGTGQVVSLESSIADRVRWVRQQATASGDEATLRALDEAAELPGDAKMKAENRITRKYALLPSDQKYSRIVQAFTGAAPFPTQGDVADWRAGAQFSGSKLEGIFSTNDRSGDLRSLGLDMPIPFFVIQGRDDHIASVEAAKTYVEDLRAPAKGFVVIDGGHWACFTDADEFVSALRRYVG